MNELPEAYCPNVARLKSGLFGSAAYLFIAATSPLTNELRSNVGRLAIARISPLHGSSATIAPFRSPSAFSAARCIFGSSESTTSWPAIAGVSPSVSAT